MGNIVNLYPPDHPGSTVHIDVSALAFWSLSEIRCRIAGGMQSAQQRRLFSRVFRAAAQMLVEGMIAPTGNSTERHGLHVHNAGRRAIELLDLAQELDDYSESKAGA